jgi:hypothetical protein
MFAPITFNTALKFSEIFGRFRHNDQNEVTRALLRMRFGRCEVNVPRLNFFKLVIDEILKPFTLF